ncbi:MAG: hypothetical protein ACREQ2_25740 [Candidatus Binatia bacterium]
MEKQTKLVALSGQPELVANDFWRLNLKRKGKNWHARIQFVLKVHQERNGGQATSKFRRTAQPAHSNPLRTLRLCGEYFSSVLWSRLAAQAIF